MAQNEKSRLNLLEGAEWLQFTKTWFVHNPNPRTDKILHPATFPESLAQSFIEFFTKPGDWIIDPFLGSGSSLRAAKKTGRNGVGIELYPLFANFAEKTISQTHGKGSFRVIQGDSRAELRKLRSSGTQFSFCICSPPYWSQLHSNSERHQERKNKGLRTLYGDDPSDLGNILEYEEFLSRQKWIFDELYPLMRPNSYLVVITNNVYNKGRLYPLAFDTLSMLSKKWVPKDEKIWCQDYRKLRPFGMFHSYIGNRSHHYCLIFRKQSQTHKIKVSPAPISSTMMHQSFPSR